MEKINLPIVNNKCNIDFPSVCDGCSNAELFTGVQIIRRCRSYSTSLTHICV